MTPSAIHLSTLTHANFVKPYNTDGIYWDYCNRTDRGYPKKVRINRQYSINNLWSRQVSSLAAKSYTDLKRRWDLHSLLEIQLFRLNFWQCGSFFVYFFGGLECVVGHSFAYVAHFVFLRDVWI